MSGAGDFQVQGEVGQDRWAYAESLSARTEEGREWIKEEDRVVERAKRARVRGRAGRSRTREEVKWNSDVRVKSEDYV